MEQFLAGTLLATTVLTIDVGPPESGADFTGFWSSVLMNLDEVRFTTQDASLHRQEDELLKVSAL